MLSFNHFVKCYLLFPTRRKKRASPKRFAQPVPPPAPHRPAMGLESRGYHTLYSIQTMSNKFQIDPPPPFFFGTLVPAYRVPEHTPINIF